MLLLEPDLCAVIPGCRWSSHTHLLLGAVVATAPAPGPGEFGLAPAYAPGAESELAPIEAPVEAPGPAPVPAPLAAPVPAPQPSTSPEAAPRVAPDASPAAAPEDSAEDPATPSAVGEDTPTPPTASQPPASPGRGLISQNVGATGNINYQGGRKLLA